MLFFFHKQVLSQSPYEWIVIRQDFEIKVYSRGHDGSMQIHSAAAVGRRPRYRGSYLSQVQLDHILPRKTDGRDQLINYDQLIIRCRVKGTGRGSLSSWKSDAPLSECRDQVGPPARVQFRRRTQYKGIKWFARRGINNQKVTFTTG